MMPRPLARAPAYSRPHPSQRTDMLISEYLRLDAQLREEPQKGWGRCGSLCTMKPVSTPRSGPSACFTSCVWACPPSRESASKRVTLSRWFRT